MLKKEIVIKSIDLKRNHSINKINRFYILFFFIFFLYERSLFPIDPSLFPQKGTGLCNKETSLGRKKIKKLRLCEQMSIDLCRDQKKNLLACKKAHDIKCINKICFENKEKKEPIEIKDKQVNQD